VYVHVLVSRLPLYYVEVLSSREATYMYYVVLRSRSKIVRVGIPTYVHVERESTASTALSN